MKTSPLKWRFLALAILVFSLSIAGCARTVRDLSALSRRIVLQFSVQGQLALNNPNVTYYVVLNAPPEPGRTLDPATEGPRINGTSLNDPPTFLIGRLPFTGLLPGDLPSQWTHFYYLQGSPDGQGVVGRGIRRSDGTPEVIQQNYPQALWSKPSQSTVEIQILFSDLFAGSESFPENVVVHLASSDSIDTGQGYVYDWWRANIPFEVRTAANNTPIQDEDPNPELIMRQIPGKPFPQLPPGVNPADVNIFSYQFRVIEL
jgi:hypothetical protein